MPEIITRSAPVNSFDPTTRTFNAVFATGHPISRGAYDEVLDLPTLELPADLPLLDSHKTSARDTIGRAGNFRVEGMDALATCRLSSAPDVEPLAHRIADGTINSLSVGYVVPRWQETTVGERRVRTAIGAKVVEVSVVSIPADPLAKVRSQNMPDTTITTLTPEQRATRNAHIQTFCDRLSIPRSIERELVNSELTEDACNVRIMRYMEERGGPHRVAGTSHNANTLDNPEVWRRAATDAIAAHITGTPPADGPALALYQMGWDGLSREALQRAGQPITGDRAALHTRALTTSDLPMISGPALNQVLGTMYTALTSPLAPLFAPRALQDFNLQREVLADWTPIAIDKVNEHGEFKNTFIDERGESYRLATYGAILGYSRQLWINGAAGLANTGTMMARAMAAFVNDSRVQHITQNSLAGPVMADGSPVFYAARDNIASLDTTDTTSVIEDVLAARAAMAKRKGAGNVMIGATPSIWLVPADFEPTAIRALASIAATAASDVNPLSGKLQILMEPRLDDPDTSYLVTAPAAMEGAVQASLAGQPGPHTESRWGFEVDAVQFKIRLDLGFGWPEWRSWTRLDHGAGA